MTYIAKPAFSSQSDIQVPMGIYKMNFERSTDAKSRFNQSGEVLVGTLIGELSCLDARKIAENIAGLLNAMSPVHKAHSGKIVQYTTIQEPDGQNSFMISEHDPSIGGIPTAKGKSVLFKLDPEYKGGNLFTPDFFAKLCGATPYQGNDNTSSRRVKQKPTPPRS